MKILTRYAITAIISLVIFSAAATAQTVGVTLAVDSVTAGEMETLTVWRQVIVAQRTAMWEARDRLNQASTDYEAATRGFREVVAEYELKQAAIIKAHGLNPDDHIVTAEGVIAIKAKQPNKEERNADDSTDRDRRPDTPPRP